MARTRVVETDRIGRNASLGEYCVIREGVVLGDNVTVHPHVVIERGVTLADGVEVFPGSVIGKVPKGAGATARTISFERSVNIGPDCAIGPNAVLYYGVTVKDMTLIGDGGSLREGVSVGSRCIIGRYVTINYESCIGDRTRIMDLTHITGNCVIGSNVFISIHVSTVNDNVVVGRVYEANRIRGPIIEDNASVGAAAVILPGVRIGQGAFVAANSVVTRDVDAGSLVMGAPARLVRRL